MSRNEMPVDDSDNGSEHESCSKEEIESEENSHNEEELMDKDVDTQRELSDATKLKLESKLVLLLLQA